MARRLIAAAAIAIVVALPAYGSGCAALGHSFAEVDSARRRGRSVVVYPDHPCADLPGRRPVRIDSLEVMIDPPPPEPEPRAAKPRRPASALDGAPASRRR